MTSQEVLLGELDMYKDSLEQWLKKLNQENEDLCHKFLLGDFQNQLNKEELTERYYKACWNISSEPEAKKKKSMTGKRKLKIPPRDLSGIKEINNNKENIVLF